MELAKQLKINKRRVFVLDQKKLVYINIKITVYSSNKIKNKAEDIYIFTMEKFNKSKFFISINIVLKQKKNIVKQP